MKTALGIVFFAMVIIGAISASIAATTNSGAFSVSRAGVTMAPDGTTMIILTYVGSSGAVSSRVLLVDPACTVVKDDKGTTVAATAPAALCTAISSFTTQLDSLIANGATGGKLNL